MNAKKKKKPKTRDYFLVEIIKGATKAGVHEDEKKRADKERCRQKVNPNEEG